MTPTSFNSRPAASIAGHFFLSTRLTRFLKSRIFVLPALAVVLTVPLRSAPALMENLGRGVIAVRSSTTQVYVGWRMLGTDPADIAFNLYRSTGGGAPALLNSTPITTTTDFVDTPSDFTQTNAYFVRPIVSGIE